MNMEVTPRLGSAYLQPVATRKVEPRYFMMRTLELSRGDRSLPVITRFVGPHDAVTQVACTLDALGLFPTSGGFGHVPLEHTMATLGWASEKAPELLAICNPSPAGSVRFHFCDVHDVFRGAPDEVVASLFTGEGVSARPDLTTGRLAYRVPPYAARLQPERPSMHWLRKATDLFTEVTLRPGEVAVFDNRRHALSFARWGAQTVNLFTANLRPDPYDDRTWDSLIAGGAF